MENTINLVIDLKDMPHRYPHTFTNRDNYSSDLSYKSHMNYYKGKNGAEYLLENLVGGALHSAFEAVRGNDFRLV